MTWVRRLCFMRHSEERALTAYGPMKGKTTGEGTMVIALIARISPSCAKYAKPPRMRAKHQISSDRFMLVETFISLNCLRG